MEIAPQNVFAPHLPQAGFGDGCWHTELHNEHEGCSQDLGHSPCWEECAVWAQKGKKLEFFHCGAVCSGVVPPAPLGFVLTQVAAPAVRV